jgi:multidrug resistance protein MdtO
MVCYLVYSLLDWPGIHTCLITVYIVSLGTTAETIEKLTLRIVGCLVGAAAGIAAIVFLMPNVTSIGVLNAVVFLAALVSGWIAAGSPRISYVGFQVAFAFFLCVIQGSAPAFDMTVARDRVIGILFGNLVVALIFTLIWPVSVAKRVDPALASLLRQFAAMAGSGSRAKRWPLASETQSALGAIEQDLDLTRYEPWAMRPSPTWFDRRREVVDALASLQGPLLIGFDQDPVDVVGVGRRLNRLAEAFEGDSAPSEGGGGTVSASLAPAAATSPSYAFIEAPLATLERLVAEPDANDGERPASYARA